jgi:hypothetical protein
MNSTLSPTAGGPDSILAARADERLTHAYEQIAQADEQLARVTEHLSKMEHDAMRHPAAVGGARTSRDRPALRGLVGLILAGCIGGAAYAAQSYGEGTRLMIAQWAPNLTPVSPPAKPANSAASPSPLQLAAVETAPAQPTPPVQDAAPTPAPVSPELTQSLQAMARDIATLQQGVEQLKANQERTAADNVKAIEQLKASLQPMTHVAVAKPSEKPAAPDTRAKGTAPTAATTPTPGPRPAASAKNKPSPPKPPAQAQARARPPAQPVQLQPDDQ